jgi:KUP system potassium uptake protein
LLTVAALGVVFGDIGTSPLYALRECFSGSHAVILTEQNVLGILSLVFWALTVVISIEYMTFITRADNRGEGGILALMSLTLQGTGEEKNRHRAIFTVLGLFGAALLFGDGMITPAISVLSAVEGLDVATPLFSHFVVPITVAVLVVFFLLQKHGTAKIGSVFGPVVLLWYAAMAVLGIIGIVENFSVLRALNPYHTLHFFWLNKGHGFAVLGAVFLSVTGAEALYADMGHFGRKPIQLGWFVVAFPALVLNYFGQGALLLNDSTARENPFYRLAPAWALLPLVVLATAATIIASQAVVSGAFSLTRQAVQLGYLPRVTIVHTSSEEIGQIYVPTMNRLLMAGTLGLVLGFGSSTNLAAAYGVAVTTTMVITTLLMNVVVRKLWHWSWPFSIVFSTPFLLVNSSFFSAALIKVPHGGWFPLLVGIVLFTVMTTWRRGRKILGERLKTQVLPTDALIQSLELAPPMRVPGTAVFMAGNRHGTPPVLLHNLKWNKILHERVILLTIVTEEISHVPADDRIEVHHITDGMYRVIAHYGFMESPDVQAILAQCATEGLEVNLPEVAFFLSREQLIATRRPGMAIWRERLFALMSRNAQGPVNYFNLPPNQVIEVGIQVEL